MGEDVPPIFNVVYFTVFGLICAASVFLWVRWIIKRKQQPLPLLESRERLQSPIGLVDVGVMFVLYLLGQMLAVGLAIATSGGDITQLDVENIQMVMTLMAWGAGIQLATTLIGLVVICLRYRSGLEVASWQSRFFARDIWLGLLGFIMVVPIVMLLQLLLANLVPYEHPTLEMLEEQGGWGTVLLSWFAAVLVAPITEEVFFRGILQNWLQRLGAQNFRDSETFTATTVGGFTRLISRNANRTEVNFHPNSEGTPDDNPFSSPKADVDSRSSTSHAMESSIGPYDPKQVTEDSPAFWFPILVTAALFGLVHVGQGLAWIPLILFGIGLGYLYRKTNSIVPCIAMHFFLNAYSLGWFTLGKFMATGTPE